MSGSFVPGPCGSNCTPYLFEDINQEYALSTGNRISCILYKHTVQCFLQMTYLNRSVTCTFVTQYILYTDRVCRTNRPTALIAEFARLPVTLARAQMTTSLCPLHFSWYLSSCFKFSRVQFYKLDCVHDRSSEQGWLVQTSSYKWLGKRLPETDDELATTYRFGRFNALFVRRTDIF